MKHEKKERIFLALTQIYRKIQNNNNLISWHKEFHDQGLNNPNEVTYIIRALKERRLIMIKDRKTYWSKVRTTPNMLLVDSIVNDSFPLYKKEKHTTIEKSIEKPKKVFSIEIKINGVVVTPIASISIDPALL